MPHDSPTSWPYYCEENIWHLAGSLGQAAESARVLIISNPGGRVAVWRQKAASAPDLPVLWDYHVILLTLVESRWQVHDPDSTLGCPVPARSYLDATFPQRSALGERYPPHFRWLEALTYRRELRSDRRHMRNAAGGWLEPPPPWEPIGEGSNLMAFTDVQHAFLGEIIDLATLKQRLGPVLPD